MFNIHKLFSDRYRGTCRLVSTDAAVHIAAFVLTSRHIQDTIRIATSRCRLVRTNAAIYIKTELKYIYIYANNNKYTI